MKTYTVILALFALLVATVQAVSLGTNAERMARGLPPRAPRKLYREASRTEPRSPKPSAKPPPTCSTGPIQCCLEVTEAKNPVAALILGLLGIVLGPDVVVGLTCAPISIIGVGSGNSCSAHAVCCENNSHGGLISIGCIPVIL